MSAFIIIFATIDFFIALVLIGLILIQQSKGGGLGTSFGGAAESVLGGQAVNHLSKATVILTTAFFIITLMLAISIGHRNVDQSVAEKLSTTEELKSTDKEENDIKEDTKTIVEDLKKETETKKEDVESVVKNIKQDTETSTTKEK